MSPRNIQVALQESPTMEMLQLHDTYGPILDVRHLNSPLENLKELGHQSLRFLPLSPAGNKRQTKTSWIRGYKSCRQSVTSYKARLFSWTGRYKPCRQSVTSYRASLLHFNSWKLRIKECKSFGRPTAARALR